MMNTEFRSPDRDRREAMTKLWAQIFAVLLNIGRPILPTVIWLNDNFEDIYEYIDNEEEVYKYIFNEMQVHYIDLNKQ